jgi:hypothetical protein
MNHNLMAFACLEGVGLSAVYQSIIHRYLREVDINLHNINYHKSLELVAGTKKGRQADKRAEKAGGGPV